MQVRIGLTKLSQVILGANSLIQSVLDEALLHTDASYFEKNVSTLQNNASILHDGLSKISALTPIKPSGAMYMMVRIDMSTFQDIEDDVDFAKKLVDEEYVVTLPGKVFRSPNYVRLVICPPADKLQEAVKRIASFCQRHSKTQ